MSISRRRVGSVSQRNDSPLPPLDIQSIQMPSNPQNSLALKTAALSSTKSLFQMATSLRKRLRNVEDFSPFLELPIGDSLDVVSHMCHVFRLGSPLCHLFNLLIPSFVTPSSALYANLPAPRQIEYDMPAFVDSPTGVRNWAKQDGNAKTCQKYIAMFCMAMKQRREEGRWPQEIWALHELWGKSKGDEIEAYDSSGLMKVLQTIELILDHLPETAMSPTSPSTPYTASSSGHAFGSMAMSSIRSRQSYDLPFSMGGHGPGSTAVANMAATMNGGVHVDHESGASSSSASLPSVQALMNSAPEMQRGFSSQASADANAFKSVEELVASERSYVQELEILERCSVEILQAELVSAETVYSMFSNLSKILDFQRKFLIKLETEYEPIEEGRGARAWAEGRWGRPFVDMEKEFECYGPYCANYLDATRVINEYMVNLMIGQELPASERPCLHPERELQAFMIKPIQRITKYGLLLDAVLHATAKHDYAFRSELEDGLAAVRRIAADINETTAFKAKQATVRELVERVDDWKGHDWEKFGDLHLDDQFTVSKADTPREYHVFLFEKMMLCCKEIAPEKKTKTSKNTSMLRKDKGTSKAGATSTKPRLALKGRIFVSNITNALILPPMPSDSSPQPRVQIIWTVPSKSGDAEQDMEDSFVMIGRSDDQMKKWSDKVMELANAERKKQDERYERARANGRFSDQNGSTGKYWAQSTFAPPTPATEQPPFQFPPVPTPTTGMLNQSQFGVDDDDENGPGTRSGRVTPSSSATYSQQGHMSGVPGVTASGRRVQSQQSIPPMHQAELRARAMTEDQFGPSMTQWRSQQPVPAMPPPPPPLSRLMSGASMMSNNSDASYGRTIRNHSAAAAYGGNGGYDSPSSSTTPQGFEDENGYDLAPVSAPGTDGMPGIPRFSSARGMTRAPSHGVTGTVPYPLAPQLRSRSASSPNVYQQQPQQSQGSTLPPVPQGYDYTHPQGNGYPANPAPHGSSSSSLIGGPAVGGTAYFTKRMSGKRSSSESQMTETSATSSQSPATPYTNAAPEIRGATPVSRQNSQDDNVSAAIITNSSAARAHSTSAHTLTHAHTNGGGAASPSVLVKVRSGESSFVIGVTPDVSFRLLYDKVVKKLRLCSSRHANVGLGDYSVVKIKWLDCDGDEVAIKNDADVQTMFLETGEEQIQLIAN